MNYRTNDIVYAWMRNHSTTKPVGDKYQEYLLKRDFVEERTSLAKDLGNDPKTINNALKKLITIGLVEEGKIDYDGRKIPCYFFPYDEDGIYKLISKELLTYLIDTRSRNCVRLFIWLANKYSYKEGYTFSISEVKDAFGYAKYSRTPFKTLKNCLESLEREGLISYEIIQQKIISEEGVITITSKYKLLKVASDIQDL